MTKADMSAKAVTARLKRIEQLRRLCLSLSKATFPDSKENQSIPSVTSESVKEREEVNSK
jgi:hypothetical protein